MAKILFTAFMADMRGKVAGTVFSRNASGAFSRTKVTPVNPQSTYQSQVRSRLAGFAQAWRGLTQLQRDSWNTGAVNYPRTDQFGNTVILTGLQLYTSLNTGLNIVGVAALSSCPAPGTVAAIATLSAVADNSSQSLVATFTPTPVPADTAYLFYATPTVSAGKKNVSTLYKYLDKVDAAGTSPVTLTSAYTQRYGTIGSTGGKIGVKAIPVSKLTGQFGVPIEILITIQA